MKEGGFVEKGMNRRVLAIKLWSLKSFGTGFRCAQLMKDEWL